MSEFAEGQTKDLKTAFRLLDKNMDGRVTATELKNMLKKMGIQMDDKLIKSLMDEASRRKDGLVNEEEFLRWMERHAVKDDVMEDLLAAFRVFDKDRNGFITKDELKTAMEMIGEPTTDSQLDSLLRETDVDRDGKINYEEFVRVLL